MKILDFLRKDKPLKHEPIEYHLHHLRAALEYGEITQEEFDYYLDELYKERCLDK